MRYLLLFLILVIIGCKESKPPLLTEVEDSSPWKPTSLYDDGGNLVSVYNILEPLVAEENVKYPLVVFLHGSGERGDDNKAQLVHIAPIFASDSIRNLYPSYVVFPQCPKDKFWSAMKKINGTWQPVSSGEVEVPLKGVMYTIDRLIELNPIDTNRIYIAGLSMGGFGVFDYVARRPHQFAAAIPICGGGDNAYVNQYAHLPMKIFHGAKDEVVSPDLSRNSYKALTKAGASDVEYIEFPEGGHDIWNEAFNHEGLLEWMYNQNKSNK